MMKKLLAMILCLALAMSAAGASAASAQLFAQDMLGEGEYAYASCMTAADGTLYALVETGAGLRLGWWREGMEEAELADDVLENGRYASSGEEVTDENRYAVSYLFADGGRVMTLNPLTGLVFALEAEEGKVRFTDVVTLESTDALFREDEEYAYMLNVASVVAMDGTLYWLTRDWDTAGKQQVTLTAFSLTDGTARDIPVEHVMSVTPYKDGKLLAVVQDMENAWDSETQEAINPSLGVLDPASGTMELIGQFDIFSVEKIVYSAAMDAVIYFDTGRLMGRAMTGGTEQYGYIPMDWAEHMVLLDDATVACGGYDGTQVRTLQADFAASEYLNVYNSYLDEGTRLFTARHPDVPVYFAGEYYDTVEKLNQAMLSGENALDVLQMGVSYSSFTTLMEKGYCADLSGDEELMAMAERLHPVLREAVMRDGKLYAVPVNAYSFGWAYNAEMLEEMELDADVIPTDFIGLCELVTEWNDGLMDDYPEYCLFDGVSNTRGYLFERMVESYLHWQQAQGGDVTFNTPVFRQMMAALENMRCEEMDRVYAQDEAMGDVYRTGLITYGYALVGDFTWLIDGYSPWQTMLYMQLTPDTPFFTPVQLEVAFINPRTTRMELALELLRCRVEGLSEEMTHSLFADETEPVENPYYQQAINDYQAAIDLLTAQLETADESEKAFILDDIAGHKQLIQEQEKYRWTISEDAMARYRAELVPAMTVAQPTVLSADQNGGSSEMKTLMNRYRDGQIDVEQFIREADSKLWMMRMENQ